MFKSALAALVAASGLVSATSLPAEAQFQRCTSHTKLLQQLSQRYKEVPTAMGIVNDKALMQMYASDETGSWTIVITNAEGKACIVATGHSWEDFETGIKGPGV